MAKQSHLATAQVVGDHGKQGHRPWRRTAPFLVSRSQVSFSAEFVDQLAAENEAEADLADAERTALQGCLEELTPMQQGLVRQYYAKAEVTIADLSKELQRPAAGLYKTLQRVREALRACIGARLRHEGFSHSLTN